MAKLKKNKLTFTFYLDMQHLQKGWNYLLPNQLNKKEGKINVNYYRDFRHFVPYWCRMDHVER